MNQDTLNQCRVFHLAAEAILPLVDDMHNNAYEKLVSKFRNGQTELIADIARLEALSTLKEEIINKARLYETYAAKENNRGS